MRHATLNGARLIEEGLRHGGRRTYPVMVTMTYAQPDAWSPRHVSMFLQHLRDKFRTWRQPLRYCWVAELTKAGRVHFHVMIWMPKGFTIPKPDRAGWWRHGMTRIEKTRNPVGYMAKYVSKQSLAVNFPKGLRLHGRGGLDQAQRIEARWWLMPLWVRTWTGEVCDVRRAAGGGVVVMGTGEWRPTPWRVVFQGGSIFIGLRDPPCCDK